MSEFIIRTTRTETPEIAREISVLNNQQIQNQKLKIINTNSNPKKNK